MQLSNLLILLLFQTAESVLFRGNCPNITITPGNNNFIVGSNWYAVFVLPREMSSDSFDFYITEEEIVQNNIYVFFRVYDVVGWDYFIKPCRFHLGIGYKDGALRQTSLHKGSDNLPVCKSDKWTQNALISNRRNPNLMLVVGCREVNLSYYDLALWVILEKDEYVDRYPKNIEFYRHLTVDSFKDASGLADIHFEQIQNLVGINLWDEKIEEHSSVLCQSNSCQFRTKNDTRTWKSNEYLHFVWIIYVIILGVLIVGLRIFN